MEVSAGEIKSLIHSILNKRGFYTLTFYFLSDFLKLVEAPDASDPKLIQQNAINGVYRILDKHKDKFKQYIANPKFASVTAEIKQYLLTILNEVALIIQKKTTAPLITNYAGYPSYGMPNTAISSMAPMAMNPMNPMMQGIPPISSNNRPGFYDALSRTGVDQQNASDPYYRQMLQEQVRLQQMYMYYNAMYAGYPGATGSPHPMMYPGMYGGMPNYSGSIPTAGFQNGARMPVSGNMAINKPATKILPQPSTINLVGDTNNQTNTNNNTISQESQSNKQNNRQRQKSQNQNDDKKNEAYLPPSEVKKAPMIDLSLEKKKPSKQENFKGKIPNPKNFVQEPIQQFKFCACQGHFKYEEHFQCFNCKKSFHFFCLNEPIRKLETRQKIQCYFCRLKGIDPLNRVKEVISQHYITNLSESKFKLTANFKPFQGDCKKKNGRYEIEMRCLKVSQSSSDSLEITWPDQCVIKLNEERIIQIPALQTHSSLKKRKDYSITITQNIYNKNSQEMRAGLQSVKLSLEIKSLSKEEVLQKKIRNDFTFAFAIYLVEKYTVDELYSKIVAYQQTNQVNYIERLMKTEENEVEIDKIVINLYDPYTWDLIKTPVRGQKCMHGQCFDLKIFISFMAAAKNRTWKCPVCLKDSRKFMIDRQVEDLIKRVSESKEIPNEISFMKDGSIVLKMGEDSQVQNRQGASKNKKENNPSQDDKQADSKLSKTKKIHKNRQFKKEKESNPMKSLHEHDGNQSHAGHNIQVEKSIHLESPAKMIDALQPFIITPINKKQEIDLQHKSEHRNDENRAESDQNEMKS